MPFLSIITITFNAEQFLERTIESIVQQTGNDFEFIIVDGASKDNTIAIAKKYGEQIDLIVSEPDKGIYDAMNKGLRLAKGDFIWFMNAGDQIAENNTITKIKNQLKLKTDLIYGDAWFVDNQGAIKGKRTELTPHKLKANLRWTDLQMGMLVCHQSLIVKKDIAPNFILENLSADVDWEIKCFKASHKTLFLDYPISKYLEGGVSVQQQRTSWLGRYYVLQSHFGFWENLINHAKIVRRSILLFLKK